MLTIVRSALILLGTMLVTLPVSAASTYVIGVSRGSGGTIRVELYGLQAFCQIDFGAFIGAPLASRTQNVIDVQSTIAAGECSPGGPPEPPLPYRQQADVGVLPDGTYSVTWTLNGFGPVPNTPRSYRGAFLVINGSPASPQAVPATGGQSLALLTVLVLASALLLMQRASITAPAAAASAAPRRSPRHRA
jgi:hypothetical protein